MYKFTCEISTIVDHSTSEDSERNLSTGSTNSIKSIDSTDSVDVVHKRALDSFNSSINSFIGKQPDMALIHDSPTNIVDKTDSSLTDSALSLEETNIDYEIDPAASAGKILQRPIGTSRAHPVWCRSAPFTP